LYNRDNRGKKMDLLIDTNFWFMMVILINVAIILCCIAHLWAEKEYGND